MRSVLAIDDTGAALPFSRLVTMLMASSAIPGIKLGIIEDLIMEFDDVPEGTPRRT